MDWLTALAAQDQSFEAQLAKRDLSKKIALLQDLAQQQEQRRQFGMNKDLEERRLTAQTEHNKALMAQTQADRDELKRRAEIDDKRQQQNQYLSAPAGTVLTDPEVVNSLMKTGRVSRDPNFVGPTEEGTIPPYVLDRQEAERKAAEAESLANSRRLQEQHQKETLAMEHERLAMAKREETQRNREREQRIKANDARVKALQDKANEMLPEFRQAFELENNRILKQMDIDPSFLEGLRGLTQEQVEEQRLAKTAALAQKFWDLSENTKRARKGQGPLPTATETEEGRINRLVEEQRKKLGGG